MSFKVDSGPLVMGEVPPNRIVTTPAGNRVELAKGESLEIAPLPTRDPDPQLRRGDVPWPPERPCCGIEDPGQMCAEDCFRRRFAEGVHKEATRQTAEVFGFDEAIVERLVDPRRLPLSKADREIVGYHDEAVTLVQREHLEALRKDPVHLEACARGVHERHAPGLVDKIVASFLRGQSQNIDDPAIVLYAQLRRDVERERVKLVNSPAPCTMDAIETALSKWLMRFGPEARCDVSEDLNRLGNLHITLAIGRQMTSAELEDAYCIASRKLLPGVSCTVWDGHGVAPTEFRGEVASRAALWSAADVAEARLANVVGADRARQARAEAFAEATRTPWPNRAVVLERLKDAYHKAVAGTDGVTTAQQLGVRFHDGSPSCGCASCVFQRQMAAASAPLAEIARSAGEAMAKALGAVGPIKRVPNRWVGISGHGVKPDRIKVGQRWRCTKDTTGRIWTVMGIRPKAWTISEPPQDIADFEEPGASGLVPAMLTEPHWEFLGYEKPARVDVGQLWYHPDLGEPRTVTSVWGRGSDEVELGSHGAKASKMLQKPDWIYLGQEAMVQGHEMRAASAMTEIAKSHGLRWQLIQEGRCERVRATVTAGPVANDGANVIVVLLRAQANPAENGVWSVEKNGSVRRATHEERIDRVFDKHVTFPSIVRVINQDTAQQLVASRPVWLHEKGFFLAVAAVREWCDARPKPARLDVVWGCSTAVLERYHRARYEGLTVDAATRGAGPSENPSELVHIVCQAYERGRG